jgi:outer membrane protein assembly factor BamB
MLLRIDRKSGRIPWNKDVLKAPLEPIHPLNSYASSTRATDGRLVFVCFLDGANLFVAAYDFEGRLVWERRPGVFSSKHGFCSCPVVYYDRLIVNGDHDGDWYLLLLDKSNGETIWKTPREGRTRSYAVPRVVPVDGTDQIVLTGSFATSGFDPQTGRRLWSRAGPSEQMAASILHGGDLIFTMGGSPERRLPAILKGGVGDVTSSHIVWRTHKGVPYVPSALLYDNLLHVVSDEGVCTSFNPATGSKLSRRRIASHVSGSLMGGDGKVYITSDTGETTVWSNAPRAEIVGRGTVGEDVYSSPAISDGEIFIRGVKQLFCIGGRRDGEESTASAPRTR